MQYYCLEFTLMTASIGVKSPCSKKMYWIQYCFAEKYHDLKITSKLSEGNKGYHSANSVSPNGDISSALNNLKITSTMYQSHVDHCMKNRQMTDTRNILGEQLKQLYETNTFLARKGQLDKNTKKKNDR